MNSSVIFLKKLMKKIIEKETFIQLSVIVISVYSHAGLKKCLESIMANGSRGDIEIIVADACSESDIEHLKNEFPQVNFLRFPNNTGIPVLSASAIARSKGKIIALTDSSCVVEANWTTAIINAHRNSSPVIGGAVDVCGRKKMLDWAAYFCEYGEFMSPLTPGITNVLPGNNITFKRSAIEMESKFIKGEFWKTLWCQMMQKKGIELIADPSIRVFYTKEFKFFPFMIRRFNHGRCFAEMRSEAKSIAGRIIYALGSVVLPFVLLYRVSVAILKKNRFLIEFLLALPFIFLAVLMWSFGETCGYFAGAGKSCRSIN